MTRLQQILVENTLKVTPPRLAILDVFSEDCKPINAEYIFDKLKKKNINLVTIYRTLSSFEKAGILKRVDLHKDAVYYELGNHHHHHIVCTLCGAVESFDDCDIKVLSKKVLNHSTKFKKINQHSLEFFGVCKVCDDGGGRKALRKV